MNNRIDDINTRFDDQTFWFQFILGALTLIIGGLIAQWILMWRRLVGVDKTVELHLSETEEKKLLALQREEIGLLQDAINELRTRIKELEVKVAT